ncbi:MAG: VWA-like domain-containing protein [Solidesulfovibrio sp.]|uniref:vWA domain-containing protein n=1 Tax=Solidesulfovibrio sp. TaxID=2910990 RepID=UPI002B205877|nr:VWA-like domain-containing protein [Solidesulfovibrio sp.]MEA4854821.1 VWA-like domain-containing protein [Solidesulfovibrio sp.]
MNGPDPVTRKLSRARMELVLAHPFFGAMALRLSLREDTGCRDLWTDGVTLGYNPNALAGRDEEEVTSLLAHVILHVSFEHHLRRRGRDKTLWNKACDLAINGLLVEAGFTLPKGSPFEAARTGLTAEAIYASLAADLEERPGGGGGKPARRREAASPEALGGGEGSAPFAGKTPEATAAKDAPDMARAKKARQSASGDKDAPDKARDGAPGAIAGEVRDHPDLAGDPSEAKARDLAARVRQDVGQSLRAAADMGNLPGNLARHLGELSRPKLPWATLLRRFVLSRAVGDFTWSPPNRRHIHAGLYLPSPRSQTLGDVVLAIDTSGSVGRALLAAFCAELSAILDVCDARLVVYFCDAAASQPVILTRNDPPLSLFPTGGGGTDYRPVFLRVAAEGLRPACLIYLTDLQCDRFPDEPDYPVLWAAPPGSGNRPPFGEVLELPPL